MEGGKAYEKELAALLSREHGLSLKHLQLALDWQTQNPRPLGEVLLQMCAVTEDALKVAESKLAGAPKTDSKEVRLVERRRHARVSTNCGFSVTLSSPVQGRANVLNLCRGGMCMAAGAELSVGSIVAARIRSPGGTELKVDGRVSRRLEAGHKKWYFGIEFFEIGAAAEMALKALMGEATRFAAGTLG